MPDLPQSEIDALGAFRFLANKYGGSPQSIEKKISDLEEDNRKYRQEVIPPLEEKAKKVPADGAVILTGDAAKEYTELTALGKLTEIQDKLKKGEEAQNKLAERNLRDSASRFAKAAGLADEAVDTLVAIPALQGATFAVKKGKVKDAKGQEVDGEIAYLTLPGDDAKELKFEDAKEQVPALKGLRNSTSTDGRRNGAPFVQQPAGGDDKGGKTVYDRIREQRAPKAPTAEDKKVPPIEQRLGMVRAD